MTPAGYLLTWPTGNMTADAGSKPPPKYRGVSVEPLYKDPGLFERDAALIDLLRRVTQDSEWSMLDQQLKDDITAVLFK